MLDHYSKSNYAFEMPQYQPLFPKDLMQSDNCILRLILQCFEKNSFIRKNDLDVFKKRSLTVCSLYSNSELYNNTIDRLYFEMVRYMNCEFDRNYYTYKLIKDYEYGYQFKMEFFIESSENFDVMINDIMNGIFDMNRFKNDKLFDNEYNKILDIFRQEDLNRMSNTQLSNQHHITNKDNGGKLIEVNDAIDGLLKYEYRLDDGTVINVCKILKNMETMMDYEWKFDDYC